MDTALFSQYIDDHADAVRAYIWRRAGGLDAAISTPDDIAADVWVTAWQKRDEAPEPSSPGAARAWMLRIARFTLANHIRKTVTRRNIDAMRRDDDEVVASAEAVVVSNELLASCLAVVTPAEREVLMLSIWEGLGPQEIAEVLGITENAVSLRLHKARTKIATHLIAE